MRNFEEWDGAVLAELDQEWSKRIIFYETCASTNDEARRLAKAGSPAWRVILAENQTTGRGRRGQVWHCPPGTGIAMSVILRPDFSRNLWARLALATGLAVAEALDHFGLSAEVKWPNDVWVDRKKICGILVEAEDDFVIIGIGLNVNVSVFPSEMVDPATSLFLEIGELVGREEVLLMLLRRLESRVAQVANDFSAILAALRPRCALTGKRIELELPLGNLSGTMRGIGENGELLLEMESGEILGILQADRIRLKAE